VQLYAADTAIGVTLPAQQLSGLARVDLAPNKVAFAVPSQLAYPGCTGEFVWCPDPFS
jgi:beta-glucosidase